MKEFIAIFITVFLAELGDKTQMATLLFASQKRTSPVLVFIAASFAMVLATLMAVTAGRILGLALPQKVIKYAAGVGFIIIGILIILSPAR